MFTPREHKIGIVLFLLLVIGHALFTQPTKVIAQNSSDSIVFEPLKKGKAIIPFKLINNLAIIELTVNDSKPMQFIVDSGVGRTIISELPIDSEISLKKVDKVALRGLGGEQLVYGFRSTANELKFGKVMGANAEIIILEQDLLQLSKLMGTYVHGIIGYDLFGSFIVEFDYSREFIVLYEKENRRKINQLKRSRFWKYLPIEVDHTKAYAFMNVKNGYRSDAISLRLLLDTGSSGALTLFTSKTKEINPPNDTQAGLLGIGLGGEIYGELGRIYQAEIGPFQLEKPVVAYPDSNYSSILNASENRNGSIGSDILRRFKILYDFHGKNLLLRKNKFYSEAYTYNRSGVDISTPYPNVPIFVVSKVQEGSEAEKNGLLKGDQIDKVHGKSTINMNLTEVLNYFRQGKNGEISLVVSRDSLTVPIDFSLDELLKIDL